MLAAGALERGAEAIGLDFSPEAVELARKVMPNARFELGDAQAMPYSAKSFDAVLCGYGLMHLPERAAALREILACYAQVPERRSAFGTRLASVLAWFTKRLVQEAAWTWLCRTDRTFSNSDRRSEC